MTRALLALAAWVDASNRAPTWLLELLERAGLLDLERWPRPRPGWRGPETFVWADGTIFDPRLGEYRRATTAELRRNAPKGER